VFLGVKFMTKYVLRKTCTRGRKGDIVDVRPEDVAPLKVNNIIDDPIEEPKEEKVSAPKVQKIVEPSVKKRGKRASNSGN
jgi:hypothetical protein